MPEYLFTNGRTCFTKLDLNDTYVQMDVDDSLELRGAYDKFPDFFRMGTFIDSTHMKL